MRDLRKQGNICLMTRLVGIEINKIHQYSNELSWWTLWLQKSKGRGVGGGVRWGGNKNSNNGSDQTTKTRRRRHSASANDNNKINDFPNVPDSMKKRANIANRTKTCQKSQLVEAKSRKSWIQDYVLPKYDSGKMEDLNQEPCDVSKLTVTIVNKNRKSHKNNSRFRKIYKIKGWRNYL